MGDAEYNTIASVKQHIKIPVIANGDITTPEKAKFVLDFTKADAVMIGRAAQGRPWIFRETEHFLRTGEHLLPPTIDEIQNTTISHVNELYNFYGEQTGLRVARKHISWYTKGLRGSAQFRFNMNQIENCDNQLHAINNYFNELREVNHFISYDDEVINKKETMVA